ncbi:MFS transporter, DHA1 family, multidrug resistance protein [Sporothrix schenckii 1099-18]|uniref:MFS transporter, DHA1 family, multidrug resistance protein n=1 Tax=Sporothrix schenckii 1099-18 TaxID=1397361 RepID=A0A0F2MFJ2_SPOSC|nr:MFS transporter, DHA1 family, multidrug resistance protein [Sporothrix schenckii 1099-18]KJR87610.1 MFS transporter, DHA1 family, multidrug resistance protein [Sporothrix schenckii 1099-18]
MGTDSPAPGLSDSSQITFDLQNLSMGRGRPFPPPIPDPQHYLVDFDLPDDQYHPYNWKLSKRVFLSILVCSGTFVASFNSAAFAPAIEAAGVTFGASAEVATLGTTLFVLGFVAGPILWAPFSELQGRKWPLTIALVGGGIFSIGAAASKDIQTLLICRFFAGVCGSSPFSVVPGVLSDLFDNSYRGVAIAIYALTVFEGPFMAPIVGSFIVASPEVLSWRWTLYIPAILSLIVGGISTVFLQETYAPCLLVKKAVRLRELTNNWGIHARHERTEAGARELIDKYFMLPLKLLFTEPIVFLVSLYMSIIYGIVYALLEAYPYVFQHVYGMGTGASCLPFLGLFLGVLFACAFIVMQQAEYVQLLAKHDNVLRPEWPLRSTIVGAPVLSAGIFWFGWTAFTSSIHWAVPTAAGAFIGFGTLCVFLPCFNYLINAYLPFCCKRDPAFLGCGEFPTLFQTNVPGLRHAVGMYTTWRLVRGHDPHSSYIPSVGAMAEAKE